MKVYFPGFLLFFITNTLAQTPLNIKVNFQDSKTKTPSGWLRDFGESYGTRSNGFVYGWVKKSDKKTPLSLTKNGRKRSTPSDVTLATLIYMQGNNVTESGITRTEGIWEVKAANGSYLVTVSVGDADKTNSKHSINIEGVKAISGFVPTSKIKFKSATITVSVSDGRLTVDATGGKNTKINYIIIKPSGSLKPTVSITSPVVNQNFTALATFTMTADAADIDGTISTVDFYNGNTLLNTQHSIPYRFTWKNVPAGNYTLTAIATDNNGNTTISSAVPISVTNNVINPSVVSVNPSNGSGNVSVSTSISTNILKLPNSGIDNNTVTSSNVFLTEAGINVPANVNGTGGGDAIILVPTVALDPNTSYSFNITNGVKDLSGASFVPYSSTFTTGSTVTPPSTTIKFTKTDLPNAAAQYTNLAIGPDGKLYALTVDGVIHRFVINSDGTLQDAQLIYTLQDSYGLRRQTLSIGLTFDPSSTADNLILWVSHCNTYVFVNAPDWDGRITKLSGPNLENYQDVLINLPRSAKDHVTNNIAFGPDNALYFTQGSTSGMGMADIIWGNRSEHLLNAAVLRLDVSKIGSFPFDVKTADGGGTYDPYALDAPLTIYASGIRNAYDLVWHSNGCLYSATNGSAPGSNTPASVAGTVRPDGTIYNGPVIPSLINVQQTQNDYLYNIVQGGYYGHPNPTRGEYVMNGGNPTAAVDPAEVTGYPVGTQPDANWRGYAFNFKNNCSPDGAIEYTSNTFGGALQGKLLIVRYSAHDDIMALTLDNNTKNVSSFMDGTSIPGFSGFIDPLALVEDVTNGNLYVAEYGGQKLTLLKPDTSNTSPRQSLAANISHPNPEFVSGDYPNVNSSCDDNSPTALRTSPFNTENKVNPFGRIRISPNPATKKFTVELSKQYEENFKIQIIDALGRIYEIKKGKLTGLSLTVDVTGLALKPGPYFLKLVSEKGNSEFFKLILL